MRLTDSATMTILTRSWSVTNQETTTVFISLSILFGMQAFVRMALRRRSIKTRVPESKRGLIWSPSARGRKELIGRISHEDKIDDTTKHKTGVVLEWRLVKSVVAKDSFLKLALEKALSRGSRS